MNGHSIIKAAFLALALTACGVDSEPEVEYRKRPTGDAAFDAVKPTIDAKCGPCHNGTGQRAFDSAARIKSSAALTRIENNTMPPGGGLDGESKAQLVSYLKGE